MATRLAALLLCLALAAPVVAADKQKIRYNKLPAVAVELWDQNGIFHQVVAELLLVMPEDAKVAKGLHEKIQRVLSVISYEEFVRSNPAALIKSMALEVVRKEPDGDKIQEVLISRLVMR
jgi:hypothetical protein